MLRKRSELSEHMMSKAKNSPLRLPNSNKKTEISWLRDVPELSSMLSVNRWRIWCDNAWQRRVLAMTKMTA